VAAGLPEFSRKIWDALEQHLIVTPTQPLQASTPKTQTRPFLESRNARRQRLVQHLHDAGPRPTLEVLLAVEKGQPLDLVLSEFARVPVATYHATGASELPINQRLAVINGGRDD
jgi:hypothetical protein